jgi:acyl-coenzyme A synthetase/AMP-(fatty) acid ligase
VLSAEQRYRLMLNPALGAGNFLHVAAGTSPDPTIPLVWSDVPYSLMGRTCTEPLSLTSLKEATDALAAWYASRGVRAKDPVAVYGSNGIHYLLHYVALTGLGAIPALTNGNMPPQTAVQHFRRIGAIAVAGDPAQLDAIAGLYGADEFRFVCRMDEIAPEGDGAPPPGYPFPHDYLDPVMITHSSGTTGAPKPVLLQHGKWFHGIRHLLGLPPAQGAERYLSSLPVSHNAAIAYAMHAILCGAALMIVSRPQGAAVLECIEQFQPSTVVSFPATYVEMVGCGLAGRSLTSVSNWINSGDAAHEAHIRQLVQHGYHYRGKQRVQGSQFIDGLGSSEMGHSSFRVVYTAADRNFERCVGLPQEWVDARVLADDGSELPVGQVGKLGIKSPSVTSGYWNDSVLTHRSQLAGYWLTGDLVYKDSKGCFYHVDRITDAITTTEGVLYSLQTEELILKNQPELLDCTIVGVPDEHDPTRPLVPVVFAFLRAGAEAQEGELLDRINADQRARKRPTLARVQILRDGGIPVGVTGKVMKAALRQQQQGRHDADRTRV